MNEVIAWIMQNNRALAEIKKVQPSKNTKLSSLVGYTGFEPVTPALSRRCSKPTELISLLKDWVAKLEKY